ncbi:MAG: hypothetical protein JST64_15600, partial [Actinobacteria bacterium]|nr:hypothetical protein [Actinomycetota bacterium]
SVSELTERVHRLALDEVAPLRSRIDVAVGAGGPVEQRCLLSAGLLAAGALRRPEHLERCAAMSPAVRSTFEDVAALVSAEVQQAGVVPLLEQIHWDGLPTLRTQPAWRRRPSRASAATVGSRQAAGAGLEPGSLEALVMEATLDVVAERLTGILPALLASEAPVLRRSSGRIRRSASTRALTMRMGRIDWAATFADSGRSRCWHAVDGGVMLPWAVAVGIDEGERLGLLSATHSDPPDAGWRRA